jgi:hypothetical protein
MPKRLSGVDLVERLELIVVSLHIQPYRVELAYIFTWIQNLISILPSATKHSSCGRVDTCRLYVFLLSLRIDQLSICSFVLANIYQTLGTRCLFFQRLCFICNNLLLLKGERHHHSFLW